MQGQASYGDTGLIPSTVMLVGIYYIIWKYLVILMGHDYEGVGGQFGTGLNPSAV